MGERNGVKLLLTDAGIRNASIRAALVDLLGKPIEEASALLVPTALHPIPNGARQILRSIEGEHAMTSLGWKSTGLLELAALRSVGRDRWETVVREADCLLVEGGDALFLAHWMRESGLADLLPELTELTYVGLSAGSMVMTPSIGAAFESWLPPDGNHGTLGLVDFSLCPHVAFDGGEGNSMEQAQKWAATIGRRAYLTDDQTAIRVVDGVEEVVSEGTWRLVNA